MKKALLPLTVLGFLALSAPAMAVPTRAIFGFSGTTTVELVLDGGTTIIQSDSTGWYSDIGFHDDGNQNYFAGLCGDACSPQGELRDFADGGKREHVPRASPRSRHLRARKCGKDGTCLRS